MSVKLVNLTPHPITLFVERDREGEVKVTIPPSGIIARCQEEVEFMGVVSFEVNGTINHIPVLHKSLKEVVNLPEPKEGVMYIVSLPVAQAVGRLDVLAIGESVRDENGRVIGAKALATTIEVMTNGD